MPAQAGYRARVPEKLVQHQPIRLKRTQLNDNDAGGRLPYANYSKKTGMLDNLYHYNADTYGRLMRLAQDLSTQGELYHYVAKTFGLSARQIGQIVENTQWAADIMKRQCVSGSLRFNLDSNAYLLTGEVEKKRITCDGA